MFVVPRDTAAQQFAHPAIRSPPVHARFSMISAIVAVTGLDGVPPKRERETAVRSLAWLVSAVVAGVVRDVVVACPPTWAVEDLMDHAGCKLVQAPEEEARLAAAAALAKCERVLVIRVGFQPEGQLVGEIDGLDRGALDNGGRLLLRAPSRLIERLFPDRSPPVGLLLDRERLRTAPTTFRALSRQMRRCRRFRARMVPVL